MENDTVVSPGAQRAWLRAWAQRYIARSAELGRHAPAAIGMLRFLDETASTIERVEVPVEVRVEVPVEVEVEKLVDRIVEVDRIDTTQVEALEARAHQLEAQVRHLTAAHERTATDLISTQRILESNRTTLATETRLREEAQAKTAQIQALFLATEWAGFHPSVREDRTNKQAACCPSCGGLDPKYRTKGTGHKKGCVLDAALARVRSL